MAGRWRQAVNSDGATRKVQDAHRTAPLEPPMPADAKSATLEVGCGEAADSQVDHLPAAADRAMLEVTEQRA
eukprot:9239672-Pyramimonas_sp.AAC.1